MEPGELIWKVAPIRRYSYKGTSYQKTLGNEEVGEVSPCWLNGIGSLRGKEPSAMQPAGQRSEGMDLGDQREDKEYAHFTV